MISQVLGQYNVRRQRSDVLLNSHLFSSYLSAAWTVSASVRMFLQAV